MNKIIRGRLVDGLVVSVHVSDGTIVAVEPEKSSADQLPYLAPGLIDIQVNGYGGYDLQRPGITPNEVVKLTQRLWTEGVTTYCPTITTDAFNNMKESMEIIAQTCREFPQEALSIAGIHMEGPYVSSEDGPRGAHPREHARHPNYDEYRKLQEAADGRIRIVTLAPELPGAIDMVARLAAEGVVVSIGHSNATGDDIKAAALAGARLSTHLGNGSHQMVHRHRNYIWEQLAEDRLMASIITDTHHLPAAVVKCMMRSKGFERIIIISDSAFPGGLAPGLYENTYAGGVIELRPDGYLGIPGTGNLAGSASNTRQCLMGAANMTGLPFTTLFPMVTEHPANLLSRSDIGRIAPGARADMILFTQNGNSMDIVETVLAGETVYKKA